MLALTQVRQVVDAGAEGTVVFRQALRISGRIRARSVHQPARQGAQRLQCARVVGTPVGQRLDRSQHVVLVRLAPGDPVLGVKGRCGHARCDLAPLRVVQRTVGRLQAALSALHRRLQALVPARLQALLAQLDVRLRMPLLEMGELRGRQRGHQVGDERRRARRPARCGLAVCRSSGTPAPPSPVP